MQQPPQNPEQPSYPYQPQQTGSGMYPPSQYQQQPYSQYQQPPMQPQQPFYQPPMYPQQPPKKKRGPLFWILIGLATVIVLSIAICGISLANAGKAVTTAVNNASATFTADTSNTGTTNSNSTSTTSGAHYKVGQTANIASMDVTANSTKTSQGDQYSTPKAGNQYLIVDVTVNNKSGKAQTISSALNFILQDSTGQKYTETITTLSGVTPPDGSVQDGAKLRGQLIYEVPKSMKSYTFEFQPDITSTEVATWDISI